MKEGWIVKKLGEVCEINYGTRVVQKKDGGTIYPVYGGGGATFKMDIYNREDCLVVSRFAMSSQCVRYVHGKFFLNDSGLTIKTNNVCLSQEYLDKCILSLNDKIYSLGKGVAQKNLDMKEFRNLHIHYPISLSEQSRIVEELDQLSNIIEKKRQQVSELDNLAQSIFYDMFGDPVVNEKGWEVKKLGEVAYIGLGFTHTPEYVEDGIAFLSVKDISKGEICWDNVKYVSKEEYEAAPKGAKPQKGDILFCRVGTMGKPVIVCTDIPFCTFVSLGYLHLLNELITNIYVKFWMLSHAFDLQVEANVKGGTIKNLNTGWLKNFSIQIPPLDLQQLFAQKIEAIEAEKALIKQSIAETEDLFNSRMDYYFG